MLTELTQNALRCIILYTGDIKIPTKIPPFKSILQQDPMLWNKSAPAGHMHSEQHTISETFLIT